MLTYLRSQRGELEMIMLKCFQLFDKDGSGFIDSKELREISKELGRELDAAEVDECLKDIDIDKDNKISYAEFAKWWLSGRQGLSPLMRRLLSSKLTAVKLFDTLSAPMKEVLGDLSSNDGGVQDISTSSFTLNINNVEAPGFSVDARLMFLSPQLQKEHLRVRTLHSFPADADFVINLAAEIKHEDIEEVQNYLTELRAFVIKMVPDPSIVSFVFEGSKLNVGLNISMFMRIGNMLA